MVRIHWLIITFACGISFMVGAQLATKETRGRMELECERHCQGRQVCKDYSTMAKGIQEWIERCK